MEVVVFHTEKEEHFWRIAKIVGYVWGGSILGIYQTPLRRGLVALNSGEVLNGKQGDGIRGRNGRGVRLWVVCWRLGGGSGMVVQ